MSALSLPALTAPDRDALGVFDLVARGAESGPSVSIRANCDDRVTKTTARDTPG
jgi:hypothetical protein